MQFLRFCYWERCTRSKQIVMKISRHTPRLFPVCTNISEKMLCTLVTVTFVQTRNCIINNRVRWARRSLQIYIYIHCIKSNARNFISNFLINLLKIIKKIIFVTISPGDHEWIIGNKSLENYSRFKDITLYYLIFIK